MKVSVIIPTFNEENNIAKLIHFLFLHATDKLEEIIVCDGNSKDATLIKAQKAGASTFLSPRRGRASQMNYAASQANGDVLYFVHADTIPPSTYIKDIQKGLAEGFLLGGYRSKFQSRNPLLKINAYFTRFDSAASHGGDQTLYIYKDFFDALGGYREDYVIMEDFELIKRARKTAVFKKMRKSVQISARKYSNNSYLRVNFANLIVFNMYRLGFSPAVLQNTYHKLIKHPKPKIEQESSSPLQAY
ncbi:rSAM/selenodomain-associated transferase 2 [Catalinimonas alkaloidigena]|uniref:TIGR04283 family arsenosugar biosynthesis glycosyltransferase n=1 Tax=Catalinimonas alkaloidigena TaxID=1075417 RepID=UPI002404C892|nr:TIGR04283 family arsenosugar biosynthesis glycosyltransferase [Catalinimonas alkaloidigena]MDF9798202.1 rSAM/selenodomain-associated transferase 2 [Catalinimonas alkaloidigena]